MRLTIGSHVSVARGLEAAAQTMLRTGANTMQFFSRNPRGSGFRAPESGEAEAFRRICRDNALGPLLAHAPYTMNLAASRDEAYAFGSTVIREDVARMDALKIEALVLHPGCHTGAGAEAGIARIISALDRAITGGERLTVLLETMSGKGTEIGARFEELRDIRAGARRPERLAVCLDTCHVFAAGYDIVNDLEGVLQEFDRVIGLENLRAVHLNDSLMPFGSRKDRHAPVGGGLIGLDALLRVMRHPALRGLPFYLETPLDEKGHAAEIAMVRRELEKRR